MFDHLNEGVDIALEAGPSILRNPEPGLFSGFLSAGPRGVAAGVVDTLSVLSYRSAPKAPPGTTQHEGQAEGRESYLENSRKLREFNAKNIVPDAMEAGTASQVLFGLSRVLTKAVPLAVAGGPAAAALGTGVLEGMGEAQRLGDQGVDDVTAAKVGATKAGTAALVVAGGPGGFIAEQAAAKWVLENADYHKIAEQYDPFDPVGLTVSTIFAGAFGVAGHMARAAKAARITPEMEAAARTHLAVEQVDAMALGTKDPLASVSHREALDAAARAMDAGERVDVRLEGLDEARVREAAADFLQTHIAGREAREAAEAIPGFLRTADDLIALREPAVGELPPAVRAALEIADKPGFLRTAEERIQLEGMLAKRYQITDGLEPAAPRPEPAPVAPRAEEGAEPLVAKPEERAPTEARQIADTNPALAVRDEAGNVVTAKQLLDDADAALAADRVEAGAFKAAVACFLRG